MLALLRSRPGTVISRSHQVQAPARRINPGPRQASLIPGVPYYSEEWEKAFADYDPERAEAYLDEMGLTERDRDGFRLRPDGKTLSLTIYLSGWGPGVDAR